MMNGLRSDRTLATASAEVESAHITRCLPHSQTSPVMLTGRSGTSGIRSACSSSSGAASIGGYVGINAAGLEECWNNYFLAIAFTQNHQPGKVKFRIGLDRF